MAATRTSAIVILRTHSLPVSLGAAGLTATHGGEMVNANGGRGRGRSQSGIRAPGFVLCPARSGSTLLRLILNGHPEIACPPETNLVEIFAKIGFTIGTTGTRPAGDATSSGMATEHAAALCREVAEQTLGTYAKDRGKSMWVDKSLASVLYADILAKVYPEGRFICLYRQCADTVASLNEASVWSYESFGVLPFVQARPTNLVRALTEYWADRVMLLQQFEQAHPDSTLRVRYEDLVAHPDRTVGRVLAFLGVLADESAVAAAIALQSAETAVMPGDTKTRFISGIDASSVGRGWSVPFDMLNPDLRRQVDDLSEELGYPALPNLRQFIRERATPLLADLSAVGPQSNEVARLLEQRVTPQRSGTSLERSRTKTSDVLKLVLTDCPEPWMVDLHTGAIERDDREASWLALTDSTTLLNLVTGRSNPGAAMSSSELQVVSDSSQTLPDQFLNCVDKLMAVLRR